MCFALYAGTTTPIARREWHADAPDLSVTSLKEREEPIRAHFSKLEVQYIGSTSQCGCDFPHVMFQSGGWRWFDDDIDAERDASDRYNKESLAGLLRATGEETVELYGVWDGNFDFNTPPQIREEVSLESLLERDFRFKEQGFYVVRIDS